MSSHRGRSLSDNIVERQICMKDALKDENYLANTTSILWVTYNNLRCRFYSLLAHNDTQCTQSKDDYRYYTDNPSSQAAYLGTKPKL